MLWSDIVPAKDFFQVTRSTISGIIGGKNKEEQKPYETTLIRDKGGKYKIV